MREKTVGLSDWYHRLIWKAFSCDGNRNGIRRMVEYRKVMLVTAPELPELDRRGIGTDAFCIAGRYGTCATFLMTR